MRTEDGKELHHRCVGWRDKLYKIIKDLEVKGLLPGKKYLPDDQAQNRKGNKESDK